MSSVSIFMFIFATALLLFGLYAYTGHDVRKLFWRACLRNASKEEWKKIAKGVMYSSIIFYLIGIFCLFVK